MIDDQKTLPAHCLASAAAEPGALDRALRAQLIERLRPLRHGRLVIEDACGRVTLGHADDEGAAAVHVRVDNGPLNQATLAAVPGIDTWRQWSWPWDAPGGNHTIEARATDATGYTQTSVFEDVEPDGASGYPMVAVTVA